MTEKTVLKEKGTEIVGTGQSRAIALFLLKQYEEAAAVYDELLHQDPDNMTFWTNRIICVLHFSAPDASFFNDMLERVNRLPAQGYLCLADLLFQFGRYTEALVFINKTLEVDPDNVDACLLKADVLDVLNRPDELYQFICSFYPRLKRDERVLCYSAYYAALFWNMAQSGYFLKKALKINKFFVLQNNFFYSALAAKNQEKDIISFGAQALDVRNDNPAVWLALGNAYTFLGKNKDAASAYEALACLTEVPDDVKLNWAKVLIEEKKFEQAFDLLNQIDDFSDSLFLLMRDVLLEMRQTGLMKEAREKAVFWRAVQGQNPDVNYLCSVFSGEKTNEDAPLSFVKLINETYAVEQARRAADCERYLGPDILDQIVQALRLPIGRSMDILDVGCGSGAASAVLTDYSLPKGSLTGVDISSVALDLAMNRQVYDQLEESDLISFCSDTAEKYDLVVGLDSLYYFGDLTPVFTAIEKVLKPKGYFIFTVRVGDNDRDFDADIYGQIRHRSGFVSSCIKAAGFDERYQEEELLYKNKGTEGIRCDVFAVQKKA